MALTITVLSQKGGTGKTTSGRTLTDVLRRTGLRVLAVDLDPQGNLSDYFDVPADASPTIADVLGGQARSGENRRGDGALGIETSGSAPSSSGRATGRELARV